MNNSVDWDALTFTRDSVRIYNIFHLKSNSAFSLSSDFHLSLHTHPHIAKEQFQFWDSVILSIQDVILHLKITFISGTNGAKFCPPLHLYVPFGVMRQK